MQCDQVHLELEAYRDGELPQAVAAEIAAHLASCSACTEEAVAMERTGDMLKQGLHDWVNAGECPPELKRQIELHIRTVSRRRPWWQTWQMPVGAAAVAAVILFALILTQPELAGKVAAVPLLGSLAAQFVPPDLEYHADVIAPDKLSGNAHSYTVNASAVGNGVTLAVRRVDTDTDLTRVQYALTGVPVDSALNLDLYQPVLVAAGGVIRFHSYKASRRGDEVVFTAVFDAVAASQRLTLKVPHLMQSATETIGWNVAGGLSGRLSGTPDKYGVSLISLVPQGPKLLATLEWPEGKILHVTDFTAVDAGGKGHPVRESGSVITKNGKVVEQVLIDVPGGKGPLTLTAHKLITAAPGSVEVSFTPAGGN